MNTKRIFILISLFYYAAGVAAQDFSITIPLSKTLTYDDRELYGDYIGLKGSSTLEVNFSDVNKNISFIILQAHSHMLEITMYNNTLERHSTVTGTNVGLVGFTDPKLDTFYIRNSNINGSLYIYIAVYGYTATDPIPGGCNGEFNVPISPYLITRVDKTNNFITVDASTPSMEKNCNAVPNATFYMMYLPEMNFDADVYFDGIRKMMSIKNIKDNGWIIPVESPFWKMRRFLSAYTGVGTVYVVVAHTNEGYAVYVPNVIYACSPLDDGGCELIDGLLSKTLCAVLFFIGIFLCYFGHRFFKTEMFLAGFFSGVIITYILIDIIAVINIRPALVAASTLSGLFFGAIWLLFWWLYAIPMLAVLLPSVHLGFLLSAIFYYRLPDVPLLVDSDFNFWCIFILVMLLTALALVSVSYAANILCCSVLGSFAACYAFDFYMGSNLKYILLNTIRRAVVPKFYLVTLAPPFQWRDTVMVILWTSLAVSGFLFQHYHNRGRPPFPPAPRNTRLSVPEARMYGTIVNHATTREQENTEDTNERTALLA